MIPFLKSIALLSCAVLCGALTWGVVRVTHAAETFLAATAPPPSVWASVNSLPGRLNGALAEVRAIRTTVDRQATGARADLRAVSTTLSKQLQPPLEALTASITEIAGVREDLHPVLDATTSTIRDLHPQLLGLVAGWKVVGGETALTMRDIQRATPSALASFQNIESSVQASSHTFETGFPAITSNVGGIANNINRLTKPRWYDEFLKVGVSGAAAYGALRR